jgi:aspartyl-tRNA(Asn)/glutamyl-tRNA(Gln) amidotransferase subunit A
LTDIDQIANRTAAGIALAYRSGEADPVAITECLLARIGAAANDRVFITVTAERAMAEARASSRRYKEGAPLSALDGVPIGWKDNIDIAGAPTTGGSRVFSGGLAKTADLPLAANATAIGMVTMGKLNMSEFAYSALGLNPHFGTPRNPNSRGTARAPGGSSSGCGAAVAARLLPCAVGSDTGGSVRIPASFNGIVGYKTSHGRIDGTGLIPLARSYDTVGPLARSVEDCILLDRAMRGAITADVLRAKLRNIAILVPTNVILDRAADAVRANFERSVEALAAEGVSVRREPVDVLDEIIDMTARHGTLTAAEAYSEFHELVDGERASEIDRRVLRRILDGKKMMANDLIAIQRGRQKMIARLHSQLQGGLLVTPTTQITAPELAPLEASDETFHAVNVLALRNTMPGNILDLCGVALPNGQDHDGLPTSILFSAAHGEDEKLLAAAIEIERVIATMVEH